ncbi:Suf-domain-containing protein [Flagelloscypha sp. PMI_526]|nr:Suf-domain-containing protein [Flagelloscypha sp. PMI_526]
MTDIAMTDRVPTRPNSPEKATASSGSSELASLTAQLESKPLDPEAWYRLIQLAENTGDIDQIRAAYDGLLKYYPNNHTAQIPYINHYLHDTTTFPIAEDLFKRFLRASPSVELWDFYLTYVRRVNAGPQTREVVGKAYEFALDHVGQDKASGSIWRDYIRFLKDAPAQSTWEEQQKMDALRKAYHKAVQIPLDNVDSLWAELESFETGLNKTTAKKFLADLSPAHMQARTVLRQLTTQYSNGLYPSLPSGSPGRPTLFLTGVPDFDDADRKLVGRWKAYLKWEMDNPLEIEEKDKAVLITRLQLIFRKAVIRMRFFPEIWFMAFTWLNGIGKHDEAMTLLKLGMEANPSSALLHFTYAETNELSKKYDVVHKMYEKYLGHLLQELEEMNVNPDSPTTSFSFDDPSKSPTNGQDSNAMDAVNASQPSFLLPAVPETVAKTSEYSDRRSEYGLVWIMYIRFAHRAEGLKASRKVFSNARKIKQTPWEVYEAAALLEYHATDEGRAVASRIFDNGMKNHEKEPKYIERYLNFLIAINDKNNARALFERVIGQFPPDKARVIWERWSKFEYQNGDLEACLKLEKRIAEAYPSETPIKRFAQRHMYLGTDAIATRDLGFSQTKKPNTNKSKTAGTKDVSLVLSSTGPSASNKRAPSPESRKVPEPKRARPNSPPRGGDDRDRSWNSRRKSPPPPPRRDREEEKPPIHIPAVITSFIGQLPSASSFDGPVFRTDDLMNLLRNAVIPASSRRSPPPPPSAAHPPRPVRGPPVADYGRPPPAEYNRPAPDYGRPPPDYGRPPMEPGYYGGPPRRRY